VAGEPVSTAADVYSLGLVLLEALTGVRAYAGSSVESAFARLARQPEVPATLPAPWHALLTEMTARDPLERPSAAEVAARIRAIRSGDVVPGLVHRPPATATPPARRRTGLVALAVAALLAVGGLTWSIWPTDAATPVAAAQDRPPAAAPSPEPSAAATPTAEAAAVVPAVAPQSTPAPTKAKHHAKAKHHTKKKHHRAHQPPKKHGPKKHGPKKHGPKKHGPKPGKGKRPHR
jgi:eukaryotic-like serine/threonine-protein kinase